MKKKFYALIDQWFSYQEVVNGIQTISLPNSTIEALRLHLKYLEIEGPFNKTMFEITLDEKPFDGSYFAEYAGRDSLAVEAIIHDNGVYFETKFGRYTADIYVCEEYFSVLPCIEPGFYYKVEQYENRNEHDNQERT